MATYAEIAALRRNPVLMDKVLVALTKAASDVMVEADTTSLHKARLRWAEKVFPTPEVMYNLMIWRVLQNPTIQTNGEASADSDIQFVVNSLIDEFASV